MRALPDFREWKFVSRFIARQARGTGSSYMIMVKWLHMQPELPPPQQPMQPPDPVPVNYLDQIASPEKKPGLSNKLFFALVGGGLIMAALFAILIFNSGSNPTKDLQALAIKLNNLTRVVEESHEKIKDSKLRSINSSLSIYLTNTTRDIAEPLAAGNIKLKKEDVDPDAAVLDEALENARLNATFDRTYASEMRYQLETTSILMNRIYKSTNKKSIKAFLENSSKDLDSLYKQLEMYSASSS